MKRQRRVFVGDGQSSLGGAGGRGGRGGGLVLPGPRTTVATGVDAHPHPENARGQCGETKQGPQLGLGWPGPGNP